MNKRIKVFLLVLSVLAVWGATLVYSYWYFSTGWDAPNAIMKFCSKFLDMDLGWFKYVFGYWVLNALAAYGALYPLAAPIVFVVGAIIRKSFREGIPFVIELFFIILIYGVLALVLIFSAVYLLATTILGKIVAAFLILCALLAIGAGGYHTYTVIVIRD